MLQCQQLKSVTWTACKRAIETYSFLFFALYFKGLNYGLAMSVIVFTVSVLMFCVASSYWSTVYCLLVYYSPPKSGGLQRKGRPQSIVYTCPFAKIRWQFSWTEIPYYLQGIVGQDCCWAGCWPTYLMIMKPWTLCNLRDSENSWVVETLDSVDIFYECTVSQFSISVSTRQSSVGNMWSFIMILI